MEVLSYMKAGKAGGPSEVSSDLLKKCGQKSVKGLKWQIRCSWKQCPKLCFEWFAVT